MVIKMLLSGSLSVFLVLYCLTAVVESRSLHAGNCSFNAHVQELRRHYSSIRSDVISADTELGVKLLDKSLIKSVQESQTCCFMRLLLRFYIERVFSSYSPSEPKQQQSVSALANAFVSIRRDMHQCHCHCEEETHRQMEAVDTEFVKLQIQKAALKGLGELDTVLDWLDELKHRQHQ